MNSAQFSVLHESIDIETPAAEARLASPEVRRSVDLPLSQRIMTENCIKHAN